ncbi:hypothetical protein Tco_0982365 [Tanacetum coccineum]
MIVQAAADALVLKLNPEAAAESPPDNFYALAFSASFLLALAIALVDVDKTVVGSFTANVESILEEEEEEVENEEEEEEEEVENVYDESANLIHNTKAGGSSSFTAAADPEAAAESPLDNFYALAFSASFLLALALALADVDKTTVGSFTADVESM